MARLVQCLFLAVVASVGPHLLLGTHESLSSVYHSKGFFFSQTQIASDIASGIDRSTAAAMMPHTADAEVRCDRQPTATTAERPARTVSTRSASQNGGVPVGHDTCETTFDVDSSSVQVMSAPIERPDWPMLLRPACYNPPTIAGRCSTAEVSVLAGTPEAVPRLR